MTSTTLTFATRRVQIHNGGAREEHSTSPGNDSGFASIAGHNSSYAEYTSALWLFNVPGDMIGGTITAATLNVTIYADTSGGDQYRVKIGVPANATAFASQTIERTLATGSNNRYAATNDYASYASGSPQVDYTYPNDATNHATTFNLLAAINEAQAAGRLSGGELQLLVAVNDASYTYYDQYQMSFTSISLDVTYTPAPLWITGGSALRVGQTKTLTLNRTGTSGALNASLSQTSGSVLTIPSTVTIANGNSSQTFDVTGAAAGASTITATDGTDSPTVAIDVVDLTGSLVSLWHLDDASGNATDSWGSNAATANASPGSTTGKLSNCRTFSSGSSQYFSVASNASLLTGNIDFTFAGWFYLTSVPSNNDAYSLLAKDTDSPANSRDYTIDFYRNDGSPTSGGFRFYINGGGAAPLVKTGYSGYSTTGQWYHLIAWHDAAADTLNIEVNGTLFSAGTSGTVPQTGSGQFRIGARQYSGFQNYFNGRIDEVGFWKRKLTTAERSYLFNSGDGNLVTDLSPPPSSQSRSRISNSLINFNRINIGLVR